MTSKIRKIVRKQLDLFFESQSFQTDAAEQIAINMSLYKLPRKGMDDSINYFNIVQSQENEKENQEKKEFDIENQFSSPSPNVPMATTLTNVYESYGIYGSTQAAEDNLDWERLPDPKKAFFSKDAQDEFDLHNDNIERSLTEIPPGDARTGGTKYPQSAIVNKSKNF